MNEEIAIDDACRKSFNERFPNNVTCCAVMEHGNCYQQLSWFENENNVICTKCRLLIIKGHIWNRIRIEENKQGWHQDLDGSWVKVIQYKKRVIKKKTDI
jgi:hypothetical protein